MIPPCRIVHVVYRLDTGGMENGLVNLVNGLPIDRYSHTILCLTDATDFRNRIERDDVEIIECRKPAGKHVPTYWRVYKELKRLRPDIVHTRNLGTLDMSWAARLAGCTCCIHGEHGWSPDDPHGLSRKYRLLRRLCDPVVHRYVAVSRDIERWLIDVIEVAADKVVTLQNGVDSVRFVPRADSGATSRIVFGTLGRQEPIKGLDVFLAAVRDLISEEPGLRECINVVMAGDGPSRREYMMLRDKYELEGVIEFPGVERDPSKLLRTFDFFVQPSLNEGMSNTVLEAMASGLPVIATDVGGNPELVRDGSEGRLVPAGDADSLRKAIAGYLGDADLRRRHGNAARQRILMEFSLDVMLRNYERLYRDSCPNTHLAIA